MYLYSKMFLVSYLIQLMLAICVCVYTCMPVCVRAKELNKSHENVVPE